MLLVRFILVLSLLVLAACGGSGSQQEVQDKLSKVREQIRIMDAELVPTDNVGKQLLAQSSENLKRVERLLIEDENQQAMTMLDSISKSLAEHVKKQDQETVESATFYTHFGLVQFSEDGQTYKDITEAVGIEQIRSLKTSTRSGIKLNIEGAISLELNANSQVEISRDAANNVRTVLTRGVMNANQSKASPALETMVAGHNLKITKQPFDAEFCNQDLINRRYASIFVGEVEWNALDGSSQMLQADQSLWWDISGPAVVELVQRPVVDNPSQNETVGILKDTGKAKVHFRWHANTPTPRFQLQVSDQPNFFTRLYDNANLVSNGQFVELDPGLVYFRVRGITEEGVPGPFTETFKLTVSANQLATMDDQVYEAPKGPNITNVQIEIIGETAIVTGKTDKQTNKISVNGVGAVMMEEGKFRSIVTFTNYGQQDVVVLGLDPATGGETVVMRKVTIGQKR